jgi:hypothetical protein
MNEPLDREFKIRIPAAMHQQLERIAKQRGPGTKIAPLIREAVYQVYGLAEEQTNPMAKPSTPPTLPGEKRIGFHAKKNGKGTLGRGRIV